MEKEVLDLATMAATSASTSSNSLPAVVSAVVAAIITIAWVLRKFLEESRAARTIDTHNGVIIEQIQKMYDTERKARLEAEERADKLTLDRDEMSRELSDLSVKYGRLDEKYNTLTQTVENLRLSLEECKNASTRNNV